MSAYRSIPRPVTVYSLTREVYNSLMFPLPKVYDVGHDMYVRNQLWEIYHIVKKIFKRERCGPGSKENLQHSSFSDSFSKVSLVYKCNTVFKMSD